MIEHRGIRLTLLLVQAFVALTALAGGAVLMIGALDAGFSSSWTPPPEYLEGTPFPSYLVPGIVLAVVIGGGHVFAFAELERRRPWALLAAAAAGFALLIWIFVQMTVIPFSVLQAVYFGGRPRRDRLGPAPPRRASPTRAAPARSRASCRRRQPPDLSPTVGRRRRDGATDERRPLSGAWCTLEP